MEVKLMGCCILMERCRIKFYGTHDMSCGWNLKECENFFQNWEKEIEQPDINTILEFFNISITIYVSKNGRLNNYQITM